MLLRTTRFAWCAFAATALVAASPVAPAGAQGAQTGTIRGRVTEVGTQRPIADVQVSVTGTTLGTTTTAAGEYVVAGVPAGTREVVVRRLGFNRRAQGVTVPAAGEARADFVLTPAATQLEAVVTTGTAGPAERRTVGNAVTQLDVAEVTEKATLTNVSEVLQARSPGVLVQAGSGAPGTASEITIRGYGSFTTNRPVVFIDGVRMETEALGNFIPSGAGTGGFSGQTTSALDLINPQDIESIEVIKGPAAATLYGADAAGGVIQIITKKGRRGQQPLRWTGRAEAGRNEWGVDTPVNYTTCTAAFKAQVDAAGNPTWPGCQGEPDNTVLTDDPLRRDPLALRRGDVRNVSLSLRGGGDRYSFYVSGDAIHNEGVFFNSHDDRRSLRSNFTFNPSNAADFNVNVGYIRSRLRLPLGDEAANGLLLSASRGRPGLARPRESLMGWATLEPALANRYNNQTESDRLIVGTTVNYTPVAWLRNRFTAGLDYRSSLAQVLSLPGDPDIPLGLIAQRVPRTWNYTLDYAGSGIAKIRPDLESTTSFGTQVTSRQEEVLSAFGQQLPTREITTIGSALTTSGSNSYSEFNQVGVYVQEQLGWKDRLFVTAAVRADDASSFGQDFDIIVYPKASLSWVLSEEPTVRRYLDVARIGTFRLRSAWGQAGRAPSPYSATQTYTSIRVATGTSLGGGLRTSTFGNPNLKPEKGQELEAGFDADFLGGSAGVEFTYYTKTMRDLLVPLALPPSLGFSSSMLQNIGKTRNHGVELGLTATPISRADVIWNSRLNFSWNRNKLLFLDTLRTEEIPAGQAYSPGMQRNRVGYPLGSYFVRPPLRDANGTPVLNASGVPQYDTLQFIGPATPTRLVSFSNTITLFRNWSIYGLLDYQGGHYLFNYKQYNRCALNLNCPEIHDPNISPEERALLTHSASQPAWLDRADFVKLRDLSLTYSLPATLARRLGGESLNLVLAGHNLALWTDYRGLDPEVNGYSNSQLRGNSPFVRVDAYPQPMIRRYTFALTATY